MILRNDSLLPKYEEVIWSGIGISGLSDDDLTPAILQHSASQLPRNSPALQTDQICDSVRKSKRRMARRRALICASMVELDVHKVIYATHNPFFTSWYGQSGTCLRNCSALLSKIWLYSASIPPIADLSVYVSASFCRRFLSILSYRCSFLGPIELI